MSPLDPFDSVLPPKKTAGPLPADPERDRWVLPKEGDPEADTTTEAPKGRQWWETPSTLAQAVDCRGCCGGAGAGWHLVVQVARQGPVTGWRLAARTD